jgi:hypothetical protein
MAEMLPRASPMLPRRRDRHHESAKLIDLIGAPNGRQNPCFSLDRAAQARGYRRRKTNRGALAAHLPREEVVLDVEDKTCACCGLLKHLIGEDSGGST